VIAAEIRIAARDEGDALIREIQLDRIDVVVIRGTSFGIGDHAAIRAPAQRRQCGTAFINERKTPLRKAISRIGEDHDPYLLKRKKKGE
jgi:hypothetical protein